MANAPMPVPAAGDMGVDQHDRIPWANAIEHHPSAVHRVSTARSGAMICSFKKAAIAQGPESALRARPMIELMKLCGRLGAAPCARCAPLGSITTTLQ